MALIVQKYGGTSVGSIERIQAVAERIKFSKEQGHDVVVSVSAMGDRTNKLVSLSHQVFNTKENIVNHSREMDVLLSSGEQVSASLLAMSLQEKGIQACSLLGHQVSIQTNAKHRRARIDSIGTERLVKTIQSGQVPIVAGFQGVSPNGDVTTLGRGGSDTTAVALAAVLNADECQIYTDVDGIYTTDPRIEPLAKKLDLISYEEMLELSSLGSQVMQTRAMELANKHHIPIRVLSSFTSDFTTQGNGTLITNNYKDAEAPLVAGITFTRDESEINIRNLPDIPGMAFKVIQPISAQDIELDMIVQSASRDGHIDFSFTVRRESFTQALTSVQNTAKEFENAVINSNADVVKLSVVGVGMRSHAGVATSIFQALAEENINIRMISTSEIKVSVLIEESMLDKGVRCLHKAFDLNQ